MICLFCLIRKIWQKYCFPALWTDAALSNYATGYFLLLLYPKHLSSILLRKHILSPVLQKKVLQMNFKLQIYKVQISCWPKIVIIKCNINTNIKSYIGENLSKNPSEFYLVQFKAYLIFYNTSWCTVCNLQCASVHCTGHWIGGTKATVCKTDSEKDALVYIKQPAIAGIKLAFGYACGMLTKTDQNWQIIPSLSQAGNAASGMVATTPLAY